MQSIAHPTILARADRRDHKVTKSVPPTNPFLWFKATLLYAIAPYDLTLWGSIRSPLFFLIYLLFLFPFFGVADVCIVLNWIFLEKSDKHQLVNFITRCKVRPPSRAIAPRTS